MKLAKKLVTCLFVVAISSNAFGMNRSPGEGREKPRSRNTALGLNLALLGASAYIFAKWCPQTMSQPTAVNVGLTSCSLAGLYYSVPKIYKSGWKTIGITNQDNYIIDRYCRGIGFMVAGLGKIGAGAMVASTAYPSLATGNLNNTLTLRNSASTVVGTGLVLSGVKDLYKASNLID